MLSRELFLQEPQSRADKCGQLGVVALAWLRRARGLSRNGRGLNSSDPLLKLRRARDAALKQLVQQGTRAHCRKGGCNRVGRVLVGKLDQVSRTRVESPTVTGELVIAVPAGRSLP